MLAKKLAYDEAADALDITQEQMALGGSDALPLDNLDENILCEDALFSQWPRADAIIGNPPYQSKNKIQAEMDRGYINQLRAHYPEVDGRADYCVYWFRKAHDHLAPGNAQDLSARTPYAKTTRARPDSTTSPATAEPSPRPFQAWRGRAKPNVHVSIVNWIKGSEKGKKRLYIQEGNDPDVGWRHSTVRHHRAVTVVFIRRDAGAPYRSQRQARRLLPRPDARAQSLFDEA